MYGVYSLQTEKASTVTVFSAIENTRTPLEFEEMDHIFDWLLTKTPPLS